MLFITLVFTFIMLYSYTLLLVLLRLLLSVVNDVVS